MPPCPKSQTIQVTTWTPRLLNVLVTSKNHKLATRISLFCRAKCLNPQQDALNSDGLTHPARKLRWLVQSKRPNQPFPSTRPQLKQLFPPTALSLWLPPQTKMDEVILAKETHLTLLFMGLKPNCQAQKTSMPLLTVRTGNQAQKKSAHKLKITKTLSPRGYHGLR